MKKIVGFLFISFFTLSVNIAKADVIRFSGVLSFCITNYDQQVQNCSTSSLQDIQIGLDGLGSSEWTSLFDAAWGYWSGVSVKITKSDTNKYFFQIRCTEPNAEPKPDSGTYNSNRYGEASAMTDTIKALNSIGIRCGATDFTRDGEKYSIETKFGIFSVSQP